jgi:uncharacterized membrane protein
MQNMNGKTALGLDANVGALICYLGNLICALGLIYSIIVLITDKTNRLPRFHATQSILLSVVGLFVGLPSYFVMFALMFMNSTVTTLLSGLIGLVLTLFGLALFVFTIISAIKAFNGEMYKVPVIGNFAEKFSA